MERKLAYLAIVLVFVFGLLVGLIVPRRSPGTDVPEAKPDTLWRHDTVRIPAPPPPKPLRIHDTVWLAAPVPPADTTGHQPDTVYVPVPRRTDYWSGDGYEAWITGYQATLDSLHFEKITQIIERPVYKTVVRRDRWGVGVQVGATYMSSQGVVPYVGLGISYNLITF